MSNSEARRARLVRRLLRTRPKPRTPSIDDVFNAFMFTIASYVNAKASALERGMP